MLFNIDSSDVQPEQILALARFLQERWQSYDGFVVIHGTDTMVDTGLLLERSLPDLTVPIIFTGAMTPLGFEASDGLQNLTESLLAARILAPGVWLVMHNQVFPIHKVRKDRDNARFVPL